MTFETDKDAFYSDEYEGIGADVKSYGGENSAGTRPEELSVAPYSGVIKCETDVWGSEDMWQPHDEKMWN